MNLDENLAQLLREAGPGRMMNTAYDTAWVARLGDLDRSMSNPALEWICDHQLADGSWGAKAPIYYHDRLICTLAAMIALAQKGRRARDRHQIDRGLAALETLTSGATHGLMADPNGSTIGFEMIMPTLLAEAESLGIVHNQGQRILGRISRQRKAKLELLAGRMINRYVTIAFSAEMAGADGLRLIDIDNLQEANGSVGYSPSATAYFLASLRSQDPRAMEYLRQTMSEGGMPNVAPFEIFERTWTLWNLALLPELDSELLALCQPHLDFVSAAWKPGEGVRFAVGYSPKDGDDTYVAYKVLTHFGRSVDVDTLFAYERETHFECFALEVNPSVSTNIHAVDALRSAGLKADHPTIQKIIRFLLGARIDDVFWFDKWHASPYYTTAHAVIAFANYSNDLAAPAVDWILKTQNKDGSWGHYFSSAEETAYCLQALSIWNRSGGQSPANALKQGADWLRDHAEPPYPPLWLGKCLYSPELVVRSAVLSALRLVS